MKRTVKILLSAILILSVLLLCSCGSKKTEKTLIYGDTDLSEYVKLGDYKGIKVDTSTDEFKEQFNETVDSDLNTHDIFNKKLEGQVKEGDTVNIDYEGKRDGVAFEGGTAQGYDLTIGSNTFISGFEDGLIGVNIGDTVDLNLTFPEDYGNADLAGAAVVFTVKVNYVKESGDVDVKKEYGQLGFKSYEEYKKDVEKRTAQNIVFQKAFENSKVNNAPEKDKEILINAIYEYYDNYYNSVYNVGFEEVLKSNDMTVDDFKTEMSDSADSEMASQMFCYAVIQKENLKIDYKLSDKETTNQKVLDEITKAQYTVKNYLYENAKIK